MAGVSLTIIGVTGPELTGLQDDLAPEVTVPLTLLDHLLGRPDGTVATANYAIARLRPGVTRAQAQARLSTLWPHITSATAPTAATPRDQDQFRSSHAEIESAAGGFSYLRNDYARPMLLITGLAGRAAARRASPTLRARRFRFR